MTKAKLSLTEDGAFVTGANYWASHAGTAMWSDWRPEVVEEDMKQLAANGVQVLRVFPLWPDFQPLKMHMTAHGIHREMRFGEEPLPDTPAGKAGVSEVMMERFRFMADAADNAGIKLMVGIVTGWMSGRLFVPPALESCNIHKDPYAQMWQARFVKYFVEYMKGHPAMLAWDLGNECNCMSNVGSREAAWAWTALIANTIRMVDDSLPIVSGMHSLQCESLFTNNYWCIEDQAELTDVLTTHPYPIFSPHCDQDPLNTIRNCLHATAQSRMYADVGSKPCVVEEVGNLGDMICSEKVAANYIRSSMISSWANDCHGFIWWCAHEQRHLETTPYEWNAVERELGMLRQDYSPKPVADEMKSFRDFLESFPVDRLPVRNREAVCILSSGQDQWGAAQSAFILAKQAGFDIEYQFCEQRLKEADFYLMPAVSTGRAISRSKWLALMSKIEKGATLYLSIGDGILSGLNAFTGVEIQSREKRAGMYDVNIDCPELSVSLPVSGGYKLNLEMKGAQVLATEKDGNPILTKYKYGEGTVYLLAAPVEMHLADTPGVFHTSGAEPYYKLYEMMARPFVKDRAVGKSSPFLGVTEHDLSANDRLVILINYSPDTLKDTLSLKGGWKYDKSLRGEAEQAGDGVNLSIAPNETVVIRLVKLCNRNIVNKLDRGHG